MKRYIKSSETFKTSEPMTNEQVITNILPIACKEHLQHTIDVCGNSDECDIRIYEYLSALQDCGRITYRDKKLIYDYLYPND